MVLLGLNSTSSLLNEASEGFLWGRDKKIGQATSMSKITAIFFFFYIFYCKFLFKVAVFKHIWQGNNEAEMETIRSMGAFFYYYY